MEVLLSLLTWFIVTYYAGMVTYARSMFPVVTFLNYIEKHDCESYGSYDVQEFKRRYVCSGNNSTEELSCSCDKDQCFSIKTCCIDVIWDDFLDTSNDPNIENYIDKYIKEMEKRKRAAFCFPVLDVKALLPNARINFIRSYEMIGNCPGNASVEIQDLAKIPVKGSDGFLYRSAYFAVCNAVNEYEVVQLKVLLRSRNISQLHATDILQNIERVEIKNADNFLCGKKSKCNNSPRIQRFRQVYKAKLPGVQHSWVNLIRFYVDNLEFNALGNPSQPHQYPQLKCSHPGQVYDIIRGACVNNTCLGPYTMQNKTCVRNYHYDRQLLYSWEKKVESVNYHISVIGTPMSICGYTWTILTFIYFKELQNLPRLNTICIAAALLITDTFFFLALISSDMFDEVFCKIQTLIIHWSSLCAMAWAFLTAVELSKTFSSNLIIPSKINKRRFFTYCLAAVVLPLLLVTISFVLDKYDIVKAGYGSNNLCWLNRFEFRLYFYIIPLAIGYFLTIAVLIYIVVSLSRKIAASRAIMKSSLTHGHKTAKFIINLSLVLGVTEIIGFVQIRITHGDEADDAKRIANAVFSVIYVFLRSMRGVFIMFIYIFNKNTIRVLKVSFRKRFPALFQWKKNNGKRTRAYTLDSNSAASGPTTYISTTNI